VTHITTITEATAGVQVMRKETSEPVMKGFGIRISQTAQSSGIGSSMSSASDMGPSSSHAEVVGVTILGAAVEEADIIEVTAVGTKIIKITTTEAVTEADIAAATKATIAGTTAATKINNAAITSGTTNIIAKTGNRRLITTSSKMLQLQVGSSQTMNPRGRSRTNKRRSEGEAGAKSNVCSGHETQFKNHFRKFLAVIKIAIVLRLD